MPRRKKEASCSSLSATVCFDGFFSRSEAVHKLYQTMLHNVYLVPFVLGHHPRRLDIWHGSNWEWPEYAAEVPQELLNLWDDVALQWARDVSEHPTVAARLARYVEIHRETVALGRDADLARNQNLNRN